VAGGVVVVVAVVVSTFPLILLPALDIISFFMVADDDELDDEDADEDRSGQESIRLAFMGLLFVDVVLGVEAFGVEPPADDADITTTLYLPDDRLLSSSLVFMLLWLLLSSSINEVIARPQTQIGFFWQKSCKKTFRKR
jgi:hypothetical protein